MQGITKKIVRGAFAAAALAAAVATSACTGADTDDGEAVTVAPAPAGSPGMYVVMTRPPTVPQHYTATPNGWFDPSCVLAVKEDEHITPEGRVVGNDGTLRREARQCPFPRYDVQGKIVKLDERDPNGGQVDHTPTINGWIEYASTTALGAVSYVHAQWTVPALPSSNAGQVIYFFPGLENATNVVSILQPVLGYNHSGGPAGVWSLASWNCCQTGTTWHSTTYLTVAAGSTVSGDMQGTGCNAGTGICTNWSIVSRNSGGTTTTLNTTAAQAMNWVFGHVLEAYNIASCSNLPASPSSVASGIVVKNISGTVVTPSFGNTILTVSPQCSYAVSHTTSGVTLSWASGSSQVCTPGADRACCPFAGGCSCLGDQICNAAGTSWGACMGAGQAGHPCP